MPRPHPTITVLCGLAWAAGVLAADASKKSAPEAASFSASQLDVRPTPVFQARPQYPAELAAKKQGGEAIIEFLVDPAGDVRDASVQRATHPEFGPAALAAVQKWKFKPGMKNGQAVTTRLQVPIVFHLDKPLPPPEAPGVVFEDGSRRQPFDALDISQVDVHPVPRFQARPQYPFELRRQRVSGEALIDFIVDVNGDVRNAFVVRATHPDLGAAALAAVVQWKFKPGQKGGRVVNTHMQVPLVFEINER
jgi:TonB family protein